MKKIICLSLNTLFLASLLFHSSCRKKTIRVNPIIKHVFKPLESTSFVMICDSLPDTIRYETKAIRTYYYQPLYSQEEYETSTIYASIKDKYSYANFTLLTLGFEQLKEDDGEMVNLDFHFYESRWNDAFENKTIDFTKKFNKQFILNGVSYDYCYEIERLNSNGDSIKIFVYSFKHGPLQVVSWPQKLVYRRCFECE